jgi:hypothetical protein
MILWSVGFDDPKTDSANARWFQANTKWADAVFFVTDKEKCMNTKSEQSLLTATIDDIKQAHTMGKSIPLVIVINKVEDTEDEEVKEMINQCKANVNRIMQEKGATQLSVSFSVISAMNALYYR